MSIYEASITNHKKQLEFYKDLSEQLQQENQELKKQLSNDYQIKMKQLQQENRKFLLAEMHKREKILGKNYTNKGYENEEIEKILKGV